MRVPTQCKHGVVAKYCPDCHPEKKGNPEAMIDYKLTEETKEERNKRMGRERASKWRANNKEKHVEYTRQWRADNKEKAQEHSSKNYSKNKDKHIVHTYVSKAILSGRLIKPEQCEECSIKTQDLHAHHCDYNYRLNVIWLCRSCHALTHRLMEG